MVDEIYRQRKDTVTTTFRNLFERKCHLTDWRVLLAFLLSGDDIPACLLWAHYWRRFLPASLVKDLAQVFIKTNSNHEEIARIQRLANAPSIEELLSRPRSMAPHRLEEIMPLTA